MYPRNQGMFDNVRNSENVRKYANFEPESKNTINYTGYYDSYPPVYHPQVNFDYFSEYIVGLDYEPVEEFPSLLPNSPPGFVSEEFYPPPGFSKPVKTKAPNPNAVSFIPSFLSSPPVKDEKEEQELKEYGVRGILALQKNLQDDKAQLAKGKDLTAQDANKKNIENVSSYLYSAFEQELDSTEHPEFTLPSSYYVSKQVLKAKMIRMCNVETLIYAFYNMPGEAIQAYAAEELYRRDWNYDVKKQLWFLTSLGGCKMFDINKFEVVNTQLSPGPFLSKEDVAVKQRPLA